MSRARPKPSTTRPLGEAAELPAHAARRHAPVLATAGCVLLGLYVVPLYFPPGPVLVPEVGPETGFWARLFPHTPTWTVLRLSALGVGALLLAWAGRETSVSVTAPAPAAPPAARTPRTAWAEWLALVVAAALVLASVQMASFSHWGQLALVLALGAPALILRLAESRERVGRPPVDAVAARCWGGVVLMLVIWVLWRIAFAGHDPRAADLVDMWKNFTFFLDAGTKPLSALSQTYEVGVSSVYLLSIGLPFVSSGLAEPTFAWIQMFHAVWVVLTALAVAGLARRIGGHPAMLPAVAALLFSPFMLSMALCVAPLAFMTALAAALALLVCRVHETRARADVAALAAVAGLSASLPHLTLAAAAATLAVVPCLLRRQPPLVVWAAAALTGVAAVLPALSNLLDVGGMAEAYLQRRGAALQLEQLIMGQNHYTHREVAALWQTGFRGFLDVPVASLLQPFAILRSPVRLSADVYFEPVSAALAAAGIAAALAHLRGDRAARLLCFLMGLGMIPAFGAATDRASLTRNLLLPVTLPLFTVVGIRVARGALRPPLSAWGLAAGIAVVVTASGVLLFDVINPRILPTTWLSVALRAVADTPAEEVLLLEHGNPPNDWLHVAEIGRYLPSPPLRARAYLDGGSLLATPDGEEAAAALLAWSPSLEEQASVSTSVCACWPQATLYTLYDDSGLSRALAARLQGAWEPALPRRQWVSGPCPAPGPRRCAPLRAMARDAIGQRLAQQGRFEEAVAQHREALRLDPESAAAHISLGLSLGSLGRTDEAAAEFREALRLDPDLAPAHNNLAVALESLGRPDEALIHYFEAARLAPSDPRTRVNLGTVLLAQGRTDEAIAQVREALRWAPYLPEAHALLAGALLRQGHTADAMAEYRAALRDRPGWPAAADALAWILATADEVQLRDPQEALRLAEAAVAGSNGTDAAMLRTLAVAHAATGHPDEAIAVAERALALARAGGQPDLAEDLVARIAGFRSLAGDR